MSYKHTHIFEEEEVEVVSGPYQDNALNVPIKVTIECRLDNDNEIWVDSIEFNHDPSGALINENDIASNDIARLNRKADQWAQNNAHSLLSDAMEEAQAHVECQREDG
jgi:hypothetical protein